MNDRDAQSTRDMGTLTALLVVGIVAFLLLFLIAMVLPQILGLVLVGGGFFAMFSLHYLVWGRWLKITVDSDDETVASTSTKPAEPR